MSQCAQRNKCVANLVDRHVERAELGSFRYHHRRRSITNGIIQIVVTVESFAPQRHEHVPLGDLARVGGDCRHRGATARQLADRAVLQSRSEPIERPETGAQAWLPVISFTISFSSNGYEVVPRT